MSSYRYFFVRPGRVEAFCELLESWDTVVFDAETSGLDVQGADYVIGFSLAPLYPEVGDVYYLPVRHPDLSTQLPSACENISPGELQQIVRLLDRKNLVGFNVKFDVHALSSEDFQLQGKALIDVLVGARIAAKERQPILDLESLGRKELGFTYQQADVKKKRHMLLRTKFTWEQIALYCCEDVDVTRRLYHHIKASLSKEQIRLFGLECQLTKKLLEMERHGFVYDPVAVIALRQTVDRLIQDVLSGIHQMTTPTFNPGSTPQRAAMMAARGVEPLARTPKGAPSWNRKALLACGDPLGKGIAQYGALRILKGTFVSAVEHCMAIRKPVVTTNYKNWGTATGRMASADPNLQNLPKGWLQLHTIAPDGSELYWSEDGPEFDLSLRSVFVPRQGYAFVTVDYRQLEMFVFAFYAKDKEFMKLLDGEDVHGETVKAVWHITPDDPTWTRMRRIAKYINFGLIFGVGDRHLAAMIAGSTGSCTPEQARGYRREYFGKFDGYRKLLSAVRERLDIRGYVESIWGRRYYLPVELAYVGLNYLVQGSAGEYVKYKLLEVDPWCKAHNIHIVNTTHDDMVFEVPLEQLWDLQPLFDILEESPFGRKLPIDVKWSLNTLSEARKYVAPTSPVEERMPVHA